MQLKENTLPEDVSTINTKSDVLSKFDPVDIPKIKTVIEKLNELFPKFNGNWSPTDTVPQFITIESEIQQTTISFYREYQAIKETIRDINLIDLTDIKKYTDYSEIDPMIESYLSGLNNEQEDIKIKITELKKKSNRQKELVQLAHREYSASGSPLELELALRTNVSVDFAIGKPINFTFDSLGDLSKRNFAYAALNRIDQETVPDLIKSDISVVSVNGFPMLRICGFNEKDELSQHFVDLPTEVHILMRSKAIIPEDFSYTDIIALFDETKNAVKEKTFFKKIETILFVEKQEAFTLQETIEEIVKSKLEELTLKIDKTKNWQSVVENQDSLDEFLTNFGSLFGRGKFYTYNNELRQDLTKTFISFLKDSEIFDSEALADHILTMRSDDKLTVRLNNWIRVLFNIPNILKDSSSSSLIYREINDISKEEYLKTMNNNAEDVMDFLDSTSNDSQLSIQHITQIHSLLTNDVLPMFQRGLIRSFIPQQVIAGDVQKVMMSDIEMELEKFIQDCNSLIQKSNEMSRGRYLAEIAVLMNQLENIHPFIDGNGRVVLVIGEFIARRHPNIKPLHTDQLSERNFVKRVSNVLRNRPLPKLVMYAKRPTIEKEYEDFVGKNRILSNPITQKAINYLAKIRLNFNF